MSKKIDFSTSELSEVEEIRDILDDVMETYFEATYVDTDQSTRQKAEEYNAKLFWLIDKIFLILILIAPHSAPIRFPTRFRR